MWWVQIFATHPIYWFVFSQFHRFWAHTWVFLARDPKQGSRSTFLYLSFSQKHCKVVWYDSGWHRTHTIGLPQRKHWKLKWLILNNEYKENTTKGSVPFWSERQSVLSWGRENICTLRHVSLYKQHLQKGLQQNQSVPLFVKQGENKKLQKLSLHTGKMIINTFDKHSDI